jgi:hypothetical protein
MLYSYRMLDGSPGAPGSSPDRFLFSSLYSTFLNYEFSVEFVIFTNQNLSKL